MHHGSGRWISINARGSIVACLRLQVIAEGVETTAQRACLSTHGCDYVQGFLFAKPLPASEFEKLLLRQPFSSGDGRRFVQ